jgi:hypothetical protein
LRASLRCDAEIASGAACADFKFSGGAELLIAALSDALI